jgi:large subunit ribosomal protein L4e
LVPLVMARGHRIGSLPEVPLVVSNGVESCTKTKQAAELLNKLGCAEELKRVVDSKGVRCGKGKIRNRRYVMRTGPLVVYNEDNGIVRAMRNIPGVETACVARLNLLKLAPGGQFGRFVIYTEGAFKKLNEIYGSLKSGAPLKKGYTLPRAPMENADIARIINSSEVQSVLRPKMAAPAAHARKANPLKNKAVMKRLNPYEKPDSKDLAVKKKARVTSSKEYNKKHKSGEDTFYKRTMKAFETKKEEAEEADE